ncbi:Fc.00g033800.m01.CDS01 [Cosmosporella sp. VM-42]
MEDCKAELDRRRKRGRLAQSAFRKRQAEAKQNMQEENAALKHAIQAIANECEVDDRPALRRKIQEAATLAGLDTQNDTIATSGSKGDTSTSNPAQTQPAGATTSGNSNPPSPYSPNQALSLQISSLSGEYNRSPDNQLSYQTSIRPDPFQCHRCTDGPAAILPFLGSGAFTFAGRVFWYLVEKFEATKHDYSSQSLSRPPTLKRMPSLQFRDLLDESKSLQNLDTAHWIAMIEARLADHRQHVVLGDLDASSANLLKRTLEAQDLARKDAPLKWISPMSVEKRIRAIVGDDVFAVLATPALARWEARGRNHEYAVEDSTELIDGLFENLSESYVCFGDGPQWNIETFDVALRRWCLSIIDT